MRQPEFMMGHPEKYHPFSLESGFTAVKNGRWKEEQASSSLGPFQDTD
jgi:hypothetical protein